MEPDHRPGHLSNCSPGVRGVGNLSVGRRSGWFHFAYHGIVSTLRERRMYHVEDLGLPRSIPPNMMGESGVSFSISPNWKVRNACSADVSSSSEQVNNISPTRHTVNAVSTPSDPYLANIQTSHLGCRYPRLRRRFDAVSHRRIVASRPP